MKTINSAFSKWRGRGYQRVDKGGKTCRIRRRLKISRLRSNVVESSNYKQNWVLKLMMKSKNMASPRKLLQRFRDGYIEMMLGLASNVVGSSSINGGNVFGAKRVPKARGEAVDLSVENERKLLFQIYSALVASGELTPDQL